MCDSVISVSRKKVHISKKLKKSKRRKKKRDKMNSASPDYDFLIKLLALGDSGVGKTSLLFNFTG